MMPTMLENQVLACLLDAEGAQRISQAADPRWFPRQRDLLEAGLAEHREGRPVTLGGWAKRYSEASGMRWNDAAAAITDCLEFSYGCLQNLSPYLELLRAAWVQSEMQDESLRLIQGADPLATADRLKQLAAELIPKRPSETLRDILPRAVSDYGCRDIELRVRSGLDSLDGMLGGGFPVGITTLAARTSVGKSALAMNIATRAILDGVPTLYFSLEMSTLALAKRCLSHLSGIPTMPAAVLEPHEVKSLEIAHRELDRVGLNLRFPMAQQVLNPASFDAECERAKPLGLIVVDYLTLMQAQGSTRYEEIAKILATMRAASTRLGCPILLLSQINRAPEARSDKRPMLSDLRDSGNIEEVSDIVLLLHRPGLYDRNVDRSKTELAVAKNRDGRTGILELRFHAETTSFHEAWA